MADNQLVPVTPKELLVINNNTSLTVPVFYERSGNSHFTFTRQISENCRIRMDEYDQEENSNDIESEFDDAVPEPKKAYYFIAFASGVLSASLSFLTLSEIQEDFEKKEPDLKKYVIAAARVAGYKNDDYAGAKQFIYNKAVPFVEARVSNKSQEALKSYLEDLSSNPRIAGLVFSIITQFTRKKYAFDKKRNIKQKDIPHYYVIGRNPAEKVFYGFLYWVFALGVDSSLSKRPILEELRMHKELIHQLKDIVNLPFMKLIPEDLPENEKQFSNWIKKAFEQSVICDVEGEYHQFNIFQYIKEFTEDAINHSVPVLINECLFRGFYLLKKLAGVAKTGRINSIDDLSQIDPHDYLPFNNQVIAQMAVVASGTFVAVDLAHSTIKAFEKKKKDNNSKFVENLLTEVNFAGIGRFVLAIGEASKYWVPHFRILFVRKSKMTDDEYKIPFDNDSDSSGIYDILSLSPSQARLLYSFESLSVEYDIQRTMDASLKDLKRSWLNSWQDALLLSIGYKDNDFFEQNEDLLFDYLVQEGKDIHNWKWISLLSMELALFQPYHPLGNEKDSNYRKLKLISDYGADKYTLKQIVISKKEWDSFISQYKKHKGLITGNIQKMYVGAGITVAAALATGGLALSFAPQIAAMIAGEAVIGLHGAALASASLAFVGGGALAAGGAGVAGGTAIITGGGALIGLASSGTASLIGILAQTTSEYWARQGAKLVTFCEQVLLNKFHDRVTIIGIIDATDSALREIDKKLDELKINKCDLDQDVIENLKTYQKFLQRTYNELNRICKH